jgi:hypothetical protein
MTIGSGKILLIKAYNEKFDFVEAKKYLAHKGPLEMKIIHDGMYPLFRFGTKISIKKPKDGLIKKGKLACFWKEDIIHPCLVKEVYEDQSFEVLLLKDKEVIGPIDSKFYLGEIVGPSIGPIWEIKLFYLCRV